MAFFLGRSRSYDVQDDAEEEETASIVSSSSTSLLGGTYVPSSCNSSISSLAAPILQHPNADTSFLDYSEDDRSQERHSSAGNCRPRTLLKGDNSVCASEVTDDEDDWDFNCGSTGVVLLDHCHVVVPKQTFVLGKGVISDGNESVITDTDAEEEGLFLVDEDSERSAILDDLLNLDGPSLYAQDQVRSAEVVRSPTKSLTGGAISLDTDSDNQEDFGNEVNFFRQTKASPIRRNDPRRTKLNKSISLAATRLSSKKNTELIFHPFPEAPKIPRDASIFDRYDCSSSTASGVSSAASSLFSSDLYFRQDVPPATSLLGNVSMDDSSVILCSSSNDEIDLFHDDDEEETGTSSDADSECDEDDADDCWGASQRSSTGGLDTEQFAYQALGGGDDDYSFSDLDENDIASPEHRGRSLARRLLSNSRFLKNQTNSKKTSFPFQQEQPRSNPLKRAMRSFRRRSNMQLNSKHTSTSSLSSASNSSSLFKQGLLRRSSSKKSSSGPAATKFVFVDATSMTSTKSPSPMKPSSVEFDTSAAGAALTADKELCFGESDDMMTRPTDETFEESDSTSCGEDECPGVAGISLQIFEDDELGFTPAGLVQRTPKEDLIEQLQLGSTGEDAIHELENATADDSSTTISIQGIELPNYDAIVNQAVLSFCKHVLKLSAPTKFLQEYQPTGVV